MPRHILACLAWVGLAVAIFAVWPTTSATAEGRQTGAGLSITEIVVTFDDTAYEHHDTITITVEGLSQPDPGTPTVTLGNRGELEVISVSPDRIVAFCPLVGAEYICEDGDALLTVSVQPGGAGGTSSALTDSVSLTIGAVGPAGPEGPQGEQGPPGSAQVSSCEYGSYVSGIRSDGTVQCSSLVNYVNSNCRLYFAWRDLCNGCTSISKYVIVNGSGWCFATGANNTCHNTIIGVDTVMLGGLNTDGDVDGDDKFYVGLKCF